MDTAVTDDFFHMLFGNGVAIARNSVVGDNSIVVNYNFIKTDDQ